MSETVLTLLYSQAQILRKIPSYHPLANTPSHRASIKTLLLNHIYKNERIRKKLENHYNKKDKERRTNKRTQTHTTRARPAKRAMLTPLVEGKVQFGMLNKTDHFELIRRELEDRQIPFPEDKLWTTCLSLIKKDEKDEKFFFPKKSSHKDYEDDNYLDI